MATIDELREQARELGEADDSPAMLHLAAAESHRDAAERHLAAIAELRRPRGGRKDQEG